MSPFKPNYRVNLINIYLIETVREYLVSTGCHKSPCGVIAYQFLTPCSTDLVAQSLVLRVFFQQLNCMMPQDMANSYASSATVRVMVSFYPVALYDICSSSARISAIHKEKLNDLQSGDKHKTKSKCLGAKPEVMIGILWSFVILRYTKLFLFCRNL